MSRPYYGQSGGSTSYDRSDPYDQPFGGYSNPQPIRPLYHESHDDYDEPFDVRADFDGEGPRWSDKHGQGLKDVESYQPVGSHTAPSAYSVKQSRRDSPTKEELVSVPVLGPDWQRSELHELSRRGQAEDRKYARTQKWKEWLRDQRGLCGIRWLTRKALVIFLFLMVIVTALVLYFTIPRPPSFSFYEPQPFTVDNSTVSFSRSPTNFSFTGNLNLLADTSSAYLPTHFSNIEATLYDLNTQKAVATGNYGNHVVAKGQNQPVVLPVTFSYSAINTSDTTWNDMYSACGHLWAGTVRPDLKFRLVLRSSIIGLVTKPETSTQLSDIACPFELPSNSV